MARRKHSGLQLPFINRGKLAQRKVLIPLHLKEQGTRMNTYTNSLCLKITIASILWLALKIPVHAQPTLAAVETKEVWGDQKEKLNQSLQQWLKLKKECQGNYSYDVKWSSWTGFGNTTTIVVKNNKVIEEGKKLNLSDLMEDPVVMIDKYLWPYDDNILCYFFPGIYTY